MEKRREERGGGEEGSWHEAWSEEVTGVGEGDGYGGGVESTCKEREGGRGRRVGGGEWTVDWEGRNACSEWYGAGKPCSSVGRDGREGREEGRQGGARERGRGTRRWQ